SHILQEVARLCDTVTIIDAGRRVLTGPVPEVLARHGDGTVRVRAIPIATAVAALERAGYTVDGDPDHLPVRGFAEPARIPPALADAGLYPTELAQVVPDLESVYLSLTRTESRT